MGNKGYESLVHQWGVFRLPVFYVGIVVGQGMLHVRLTAQACVILGRIADVLSLLMVAAAFFPYSCNLMDPSTRIEFTMTDPVSGDTYTVLRDTAKMGEYGKLPHRLLSRHCTARSFHFSSSSFAVPRGQRWSDVSSATASCES